MPDKENKKPEFVVTDRRLFSTDGELRRDVVEDEERRAEHEQEKRDAQQRVNSERAAQQQAADLSAPQPSLPMRFISRAPVLTSSRPPPTLTRRR